MEAVFKDSQWEPTASELTSNSRVTVSRRKQVRCGKIQVDREVCREGGLDQ